VIKAAVPLRPLRLSKSDRNRGIVANWDARADSHGCGHHTGAGFLSGGTRRNAGLERDRQGYGVIAPLWRRMRPKNHAVYTER